MTMPANTASTLLPSRRPIRVRIVIPVVAAGTLA